MPRRRWILFSAIAGSVCIIAFAWRAPAAGNSTNLLRNGSFSSLEGWTANTVLKTSGKIRLVPAEKAVEIQNPLEERDATLSQSVEVNENRSFRFSARVKPGEGALANLAVIARDAQGRNLRTVLPFRVKGSQWESLETTITLPQSTRRVEVVIAAAHGACAVSRISLTPAPEPKPRVAQAKPAPGQGFAVRRFEIERPQYEMTVADVDGDGKPEMIACDTDGLITVRKPGGPPFLRYSPGSLVREFATADLDGDGKREILFTIMDPAAPLRAINLKGEVVRLFPAVKGPQKIAAADMDGDGKTEIAASLPSPGIFQIGGVTLLDDQGKVLWSHDEHMKEFRFGDVDPTPGVELVALSVNGLSVFNRRGKISQWESRAVNRVPTHPMAVGDVNGDGRDEVVVFYTTGTGFTGMDRGFVRCLGAGKVLWETPIPEGAPGVFGLLRVGNFAPASRGSEVALVGTYGLYLFDSQGGLMYSQAAKQPWAPGGIRTSSAALWNPKDPELYLGSSAFRDPAFYRLRFGARDELNTFQVPDTEKHLDAIYQAVQARTPLPRVGSAKAKVVVFRNVAHATPEELAALRRTFDKLGSPALEYTVMWDPSDILSHSRGEKLTIEDIAAKAAELERAGLPFGYFAAHGGEPFISEEAIRRTIQAAPRMFRYIYAAENLEIFYSPQSARFLDWCERMLALCVQHHLKMLFKDKHDCWGLVVADPEIGARLFKPEFRDAIVPIFATNQPYQPEVQWGGLIGLKQAGWAKEFGMSTQYWNWHEWMVRDVDVTKACPSDVMLRLELLGASLGATWFHIEGGQPHLQADPERGFVPTGTRRFEMVHALLRKNVLVAGAPLANRNRVVLVRSMHPEFERAKAEERRIFYPYYARNVDALRKGLMAATWMFEPYAALAFPRLAYGATHNGPDCFPRTPLGWFDIVPRGTVLGPGRQALETDGERVRWKGQWTPVEALAKELPALLRAGAEKLPLEAPGATLVVQGPLDTAGKEYRAILMDPGYLSPTGVETMLRVRGGRRITAEDLVTGEAIGASGGEYAITIAPGAFRILKVTLER